MPWKRFQDKAWGYQIRIDRNQRTDSGEARQRKEREGRRDGGLETRLGLGEILESCFLIASGGTLAFRGSFRQQEMN